VNFYSFGFCITWVWPFLIKVIPETCLYIFILIMRTRFYIYYLVMLKRTFPFLLDCKGRVNMDVRFMLFNFLATIFQFYLTLSKFSFEIKESNWSDRRCMIHNITSPHYGLPCHDVVVLEWEKICLNVININKQGLLNIYPFDYVSALFYLYHCLSYWCWPLCCLCCDLWLLISPLLSFLIYWYF
jgi:hypothetical protein